MNLQEFIISRLMVYIQDPAKCAIIPNNDGFSPCVYFNPENGNRCAIGQDIIPEMYTPEMERKTALMVYNQYRDRFTPEFNEIVRLYPEFRDSLEHYQAIHDDLASRHFSCAESRIDSLANDCRIDLTPLHNALNLYLENERSKK